MASPEPKIKNYFYKEKLALKLFGISLTGDESIAYNIYSFLIIVPFNLMYPILDFMEVFKHDFDVVINMITYMFSSTMSLFKTLVLLRNRIIIGRMLAKLEEEPFVINSERGSHQEKKLLKNCIWITDVQTRVYWLFALLSVISAASFSLIKRIRNSDYHDWELPYGPLTVMNITHSPNFEMTWIYQTFSVICVTAHFTTVDLLMAAVLAHISCQFKMLQNNLRRIVLNSYVKMQKVDTVHVDSLENQIEKVHDSNIAGSEISWKFLHESLKQAVHYHLAILDIASEMEHVFSLLLLVIFLGTLVLLCLLIFHASTITDLVQTVRCVVEIGSICLQVATVSYWGEQVVFESQEVGRAASEANFAGTDVRFQKGLAMVIRRSQTPTRLTAGKFVEICLSTFVWVLRTSYSSFMVLRNLNSQKI